MRPLLIVLSIVGLVLTALPPIVYFMEELTLSSCKNLMLIGMICWFVSAPFWINSSKDATKIKNEN